MAPPGTEFLTRRGALTVPWAVYDENPDDIGFGVGRLDGSTVGAGRGRASCLLLPGLEADSCPCDDEREVCLHHRKTAGRQFSRHQCGAAPENRLFGRDRRRRTEVVPK